MVFRVLPVLVWSLTAALTGTALASLDTGRLEWGLFLLVLAYAALVQGYPTHCINEIFDWKSGVDKRRIQGKPAGGSKVISAGLLSVGDLWILFGVSSGIAVLMAAAVSWWITPKLLWFLVPGYLCGIFYTLPPFRFSYRPFLGEWLGGFPAVVLLVLGGYYVQAERLGTMVTFAAIGMGFLYISIMIFFHYIDHELDSRAHPPKRTTIVFLGLEGSRRYSQALLLGAMGIFAYGTVAFQWRMGIFVLITVLHFYAHCRCEPRQPASMVRWGRVITYATVAGGVLFAMTVRPEFGVMSLLILAAFGAHKKFGKLPKSATGPRGVPLPLHTPPLP